MQANGYKYYLSLSDAFNLGGHFGFNASDSGTNEKLINLNPQEREQARAELHNELKYNAGMYMYRAMRKLEGRRWVYPCRPPVRVSQKDTWNIYVATRINTFHI